MTPEEWEMVDDEDEDPDLCEICGCVLGEDCRRDYDDPSICRSCALQVEEGDDLCL